MTAIDAVTLSMTLGMPSEEKGGSGHLLVREDAAPDLVPRRVVPGDEPGEPQLLVGVQPYPQGPLRGVRLHLDLPLLQPLHHRLHGASTALV